MRNIYCGRSVMMGHGDAAVCGSKYWYDVYQCPSCMAKQMAEIRKAQAEAVPTNHSIDELIDMCRANIESMSRTLNNGTSDTPHLVSQDLEINKIALASLLAMTPNKDEKA